MSIAELIISMCLVTMLVGIVVPKADIGYISTEWERRKLCSEIRYIKRRNLVGIDEDIRIKNKDGKSFYYIGIRTSLLKKVELPENVFLNSPIDRVHFKASGRPHESGTITFRYKEKEYYITITPISGRVLFKEGIYSDDK